MCVCVWGGGGGAGRGVEWKEEEVNEYGGTQTHKS